MITPELRQFVAQAMAAGQSVDDIRQTLRSQGWESLDVEQALALAGQAPVAPKPGGGFPGVFQMIGAALGLFRSRIGVLMPVVITAGVLLTIGQWLGYGTLDPQVLASNDRMTYPGGPMAVVGYILVMLAYVYAWFITLVAIVRAEPISLRQAAAEAPRKFFPLLWVCILSTAVIIGGTALLILPGIMFAVWFSLSSFVYLAQGAGGLRALRLSKEYVRGLFWRVLWVYLAFGILFVLAIGITAGIIGAIGQAAGPAGFIFSLLLGVAMVAAGTAYNVYGYQIFLGLQSRKGVLTEAPKATAPIVLGIVSFVVLVPLIAIGVYTALQRLSNTTQAGNLPSFGGQVEIGKMFEFAAVRAGVEAYQEQNGSYPATLSDIGADYLNVAAVDLSSFTYVSTGATYQLCATIGGQQTCEGPSGSTPTPLGQ